MVEYDTNTYMPATGEPLWYPHVHFAFVMRELLERVPRVE